MREKEKVGEGLEFFVEAALGNAHTVAARLEEGEGEGARDDAGLLIQARNGQRAPAISRSAIATAPIAVRFIIFKACS